MTSNLKELSAAVQAGRSAGGRLRADARPEVVRLIEQARKAGAGYGAIARGLGVSKVTLKRWRTSGTRHALAQVRIVEAPSVPRSFSVHGPRGLRIEGLSLDELAALLGKITP